jgi:hypothetical protein
VRLFGGNQAKGELDLVMIVARAAADSVGRVAVALERAVVPLVEQQHPRSVGKAVAAGEGVDRAHRFDAEPARAALVGERAVDEPVGQHPAARVERRPDGFLDMVGAGRGEQ